VNVLYALELAGAAVAVGCADMRWLRVAQREHYLPGASARFAWRWWTASPLNLVAAVVAMLGALCSIFVPGAGFVVVAAVVLGPAGLWVRGRTSRLAWTRRMVKLAGVTAALELVGVALAGVFGGLGDAALAGLWAGMAVPLFVDAALLVLRPVEERLAQRYVAQARERLDKISPLVVGITGSYGKTTTKNYVAHLLAGDRSVVASPRSYNNRAGLARTVNEHLGVGTEVLVAELGAYGPGEISALCDWLHPEVAVITSVGMAHLERFGNLERTLEAKAEITAGARVVVLNVDDERLAALSQRLASDHKIIGASGTDPNADVAVLDHPEGLELRIAGSVKGVGMRPVNATAPIRSNVACAVAVALELGVAADQIIGRFGSLPGVPNRLQRYEAASGYAVYDDTFNANPIGARHALEVLSSEVPSGRRVLVTPGMVELGWAQAEQNAALASAAAEVVTDVIVVGRTNRRALVQGCKASARPVSVKLVSKREDAVEWARQELGPGDAVLFENDLPDHFP